jgi:hypothetical protein
MKRSLIQGNRISKAVAVLIIASALAPALSAQTQAGLDLDGEAAGDNSGRSVSMSSNGNRLAIGAFSNDGNGTDAGHVRVYELAGGAWSQVGADIDGEAAGDFSSLSLSLSSSVNRLAIGAPRNDGNGANAGHVRVFELVGGLWMQLGLDIEGEAAADESGISVAFSSSGNRLAIGAFFNDGNGSKAGHVRVFELTGGLWTQIGLDIDGEAAGDQSGYSVSMSSSGNRLAIGAFSNAGNGFEAGHVRVYDLAGGTWIQLGADIDGESAGDLSGYSVSLSATGSRIAIGAVGNNGFAGHVRVFELVGNAWTQLGSDIDGEASADESGTLVSISSDGNRLAIGAPSNAGGGFGAGHVRVYEFIAGSWMQFGMDIDGEATGDASGLSLSMSPDGNHLAIGALFNDGSGTDAGHVRVYDLPRIISIDENTQGHCSFYPNPCSDFLMVQAESGSQLQLFDTQGKLLKEQNIPETEAKLDMQTVPRGVYQIKIISPKGVNTYQVLKN